MWMERNALEPQPQRLPVDRAHDARARARKSQQRLGKRRAGNLATREIQGRVEELAAILQVLHVKEIVCSRVFRQAEAPCRIEL